jgi:hypothetical protein
MKISSTRKFSDIKIIGEVQWMKRLHIAGIVLWPKVMFSMPLHEVPEYIFRHELEHVYQIRREGPWRFYFKFFFYSLIHGYMKNPYERFARDVQFHPLTSTERELLWKLRDSYRPVPND